ncbi:hypothetical protein LTR97_004233 [Elasticomyces elasticus]|uniref:Carboxymuconolactone decarboxylase-like domain-containing protein n=1 Tax=Elasticomyces elasticus TaxID=574655 RepID=A0AAN7VUW1_9PEZI|nr:hypothetical protein LTR97_004233 [Elasticomyces elasticus]
MNRLGLLYPDELNDEAKSLYQLLDKHVTARDGDSMQFITKYDDGRYVGPLGVALRTPAVGHSFIATNQAINRISGLSPKCKEIAILVVSAKDKPAYTLYAHTALAENCGITPEEIESILQMQRPRTFNEEEKVVYDFAYELVRGEGPLSGTTWDRAIELIGEDGTTALTHLIGYYCYVCVLMRGFDCKVPCADDQ